MAASAHKPLADDPRDESGVVIIFMVAIIAALAMMGTAFVMVARQESSAARNTLAATQAEMICRSGLSHAVAEIEYCRTKLPGGSAEAWLAACPDGVLVDDTPTFNATDGDADSGWHRRFADPSGTDICWVDHYGGEEFSTPHGGGAHPSPCTSAWIDFPREAPDNIGRYAVCVVDLDGKLYTSLQDWEGDIEGTETAAACFDAWQGDGDVPDSPVIKTFLAATKMYSLGELVPTLELPALGDGDTWLRGLTCYPVESAELPAVNVNTARESVLHAILSQVPSLKNPVGDDKAGGLAAVVNAIIQGRPFANRGVLEEALVSLTRKPGGSDEMSDRQFNDTLNSLNANLEPEDASIYDKDGDSQAPSTGNSGCYQMDFDKDDDGSMVPSNTDGDATKPDNNVTWCTTVKFRSRFFQIHVRAQLVHPDDGSVISERSLQAVYDSEDGEIRYSR